MRHNRYPTVLIGAMIGLINESIQMACILILLMMFLMLGHW